MNTRCGGSRSHLLATVSAMALIVSLQGAEPALAAEKSGEPMLWVELGWEADHITDSAGSFPLPFGPSVPQSGVTGPLVQQLQLPHSYGDEGRITFRPEGSDWTFGASVRYGRTKDRFSTLNQTAPAGAADGLNYYILFQGRYYTYPAILKQHTNYIHADTIANESHLILDFQVGRDVGLGLFGRGSTSTVSLGARYAQINTAQKISQFNGIPDAHFEYFSPIAVNPSSTRWGYRQLWDNLRGNAQAVRNFNGVGPSLNWDASALLFGNSRAGEFSLDWGANAAVLFGRQKKNTHHDTAGQRHCYAAYYRYFCNQLIGDTAINDTSQSLSDRRVLVPNLGGTIGISYRISDFKVSVGYRADFFFHALDAGGATHLNSTRGFNGLFASVSVGIGD